MLNFSEGIQLIRVANDSSTHVDSSPSEGTTIDIGNGRTVIHKHSNGDEVLAIPIVAIVFTFLWLITKAIMAPFHNRNRQAAAALANGGGLSEEEVAILHKLQRTLSQMESRVEALETILIEQARTEKNYGSKL